MTRRKLELLSPAANADIAIQAILHGADAVYIGPPSHGARKSASNSIEDIEKVVDFAHRYRAKVYATVNTIVYDQEIRTVEQLCKELYHAGVDALIIQDLGILRMKIPPIALHASTQCDIRTPEKAKFLEEVGFSQLVLARELSLEEIKNIVDNVKIPVETFIHGALCVSYSGRCHASFATNGRSANRGECAQVCRYRFTLTDKDGKILAKDKHLLSLKDFNLSHNLESLINVGVRSFKIEGRLKDMTYVKNITGFYNQRLNSIIETLPEEFERSSFGKVSLKFEPKTDKSFNRGFTHYFLENRKPLNIASLLSPKSQGEKIDNINDLNNGDGISFYDKKGNFSGVNVIKVENNRIIPAKKISIPANTQIYRTSDVKWNKIMGGDTATRKIAVAVKMDNCGVSASDEIGNKVRLPLNLSYQESLYPFDYKKIFEKLGNTSFYLSDFSSSITPHRSFRASEMTNFRRSLFELLQKCNTVVYPFEYRRPENPEVKYPYKNLDYKDNVANRLAKEFYISHGVDKIEEALEMTHKLKKGQVVMTSRHCVLRELGICLKEKGKSNKFRLPLFLNYQGGKLKIKFDCTSCEMQILLD